MGKEDGDAAAALISQMESEGVTFIDHCFVQEVTHSEGSGFTLKYRRKYNSDSAESAEGRLQVDAVLVAAGDPFLKLMLHGHVRVFPVPSLRSRLAMHVAPNHS